MSSRIPSIGATKKPRLSLDGTMLQDVTNRYGFNGSDASLLKNKYIYGDASVVEEVKKRERKIMKDINHIKNAVAEIEKEIVQVKERQIPDLKYEYQKKRTFCQSLNAEIEDLETQIDSKQNECLLQKKNEEMIISNLQLNYSVKLQELENELDQDMAQTKLSWDKKIMELENMKPDEQLSQDIKLLTSQLSEAKTEYENLIQENESKCQEYETALKQEFAQFKTEKEKPMQDLQLETESLQTEYLQLQEKVSSLETEIADYKANCGNIETQILNIKQENSQLQNSTESLQAKLNQMLKELEQETQKTKSLLENANNIKGNYEKKLESLKQEQLRRKKLENSIDDLRGNIRCFAYADSKLLTNKNYKPNYLTNIIHMDKDKHIKFNGLFQQDLFSHDSFFNQDYKIYHDACLQNQTTFNLISVSNTSWDSLRLSLLQFFANNYLKDYDITMQYVLLSEEIPSRDLLFPTNKNGIDLKVQRNSIELNSYTVTLQNEIDSILPNLETERKDSINEITVLRCQFKLKDNKDNDAAVNYYFIEIYDPSTVSILDNAITPGGATETPVNVILRKLLFSETQTSFVFDMNNEAHLHTLLNISQKLKSLKKPKRSSKKPKKSL